MELKEFIGKRVFNPRTGERFVLDTVTAPEISVATVEPGTSGYPRYYTYETINGDPFSKGILAFEDASLQGSFVAAYEAYSRTEDARWERYAHYLLTRD